VAFNVFFFRTGAGTEPVREWLRGLPAEARKTIGEDLLFVQQKWPIGKPLVDGFGRGLWEVRSTANRVEYRLLFGLVGGYLVVLYGFVKKTQATPAADKTLGYERLALVKAAEKEAQEEKKARDEEEKRKKAQKKEKKK
jgi:phage-related protein